jgi:hypothetical protein
VLSPVGPPAVPVATIVMFVGDAKGGEVWLTALWFEGRIFKDGEVGGIVGGAI